MIDLALHPAIAVAATKACFEATGRVRLQPFLRDTDAAQLHAHLRERDDWRQVVNSGDKVFELDRATRAAMTPAQHAALDAAVDAGAREGFQHRYESLRLPDGDAPPTPGEDRLAAFPRWLSHGPACDLLRAVTGAEFAFADGQATAYAPGDFLTGHDDAVAGKRRVAAYVLGLTPVWRVEWGGLLLFHRERDDVAGVLPGYNSLDLFAVPQLHSVSRVTPSAPFRRYAITGWLRSR